MKRIIITMLALVAISITTVSCSKDTETVEVAVDTAIPVGVFNVSKTGTLTAQNGTPTKGKIEIGKDSQNTTFVHLGSDFTTEQGTGTATVYLSKTATFTASPGTGNPDLKLIGIITKNGEAYYKVDGTIPAGLDYVIIWCGTASIPFGNGLLK
ncbi:DM13 domain-containing protein [Flavobacterium faecale]|uniref:DM13 domain-containing protein n=1 Tax=Flavobacterium faecale TaxID=1355330 RepID=UPI003AADA0ED